MPGATISTTTRIDAVRGRFRYGWQIVKALESAVTDDAVWTDRSVQTTSVQDLVAHLVFLLSPGSGTRFELAGYLEPYGDVFRARVSVAGGYAAQYGQLFGHATAEGRLDTIEYFDGELSN